MKRILCATVGVLAVAGLAVAAEAIKLELKDFKLKPKNDGTPDGLLGFNEGENKLFLYTFGTASVEAKVPEDGEYTITLEMSCDEAKGEKAKIKLTVGDDVIEKSFELKQTEAKEYTFTAKLKKGSPKLAVEFLNDLYKEGEYDLNLYIHAAKLEKKK